MFRKLLTVRSVGLTCEYGRSNGPWVLRPAIFATYGPASHSQPARPFSSAVPLLDYVLKANLDEHPRSQRSDHKVFQKNPRPSRAEPWSNLSLQGRIKRLTNHMSDDARMLTTKTLSARSMFARDVWKRPEIKDLTLQEGTREAGMAWDRLNDVEQQKYSDAAQDGKRYREEIAKALSEEDRELLRLWMEHKNEQIDAYNEASGGSRKHVQIKEIEPNKPLSTWNQFVKDHYYDEEYTGLGSLERIKALSDKWTDFKST